MTPGSRAPILGTMPRTDVSRPVHGRHRQPRGATGRFRPHGPTRRHGDSEVHPVALDTDRRPVDAGTAGHVLRRSRGGLTVEQRETAALLYAGSSSLLTGTAALRHYGMRYLPEDPRVDPIHVLIEHPRSRASRGFATDRTHVAAPRPRSAASNRPLAPLPRALFDSARHVQDRRATRAVTSRGAPGRSAHSRPARDGARAGQRRWTALMRDVLAEFLAGSASAPEAEFRQAWESRDLPTLLWNPTLYAADGTRIARIDGYDAETGMAVEMESREYHSGLRWADATGSPSPHSVVRRRRRAGRP